MVAWQKRYELLKKYRIASTIELVQENIVSNNGYFRYTHFFLPLFVAEECRDHDCGDVEKRDLGSFGVEPNQKDPRGLCLEAKDEDNTGNENEFEF